VQWTNVQLASYLRQPHSVQQQNPNRVQAQAATATGAYLQSVTQVLNSMAAKTAAASKETAKKTEEGRVLNEWDMAALCGYCCVDNPELCPPIYKTLRHVKNVEDARQVITKSMEDWAERRPRRIDIDRGVFLSEEVIKNIMKVTPNPGGVVATAEPSDKIVSNLVCLPRRMADIERLRRLEPASIDVDDLERYTYANRRRQTNPQPNHNNQGDTFCPEIGSNLNHLHPKISLALKDYHDKYCGKVVITQIMELAKVTWQMMPRYQPMENKLTCKDEMCWNHVFGQCPYGDRCLFKKNHVLQFARRMGTTCPEYLEVRVYGNVESRHPVGPASRKFNGGASVKQEQD
jgi:hypothetical protein